MIDGFGRGEVDEDGVELDEGAGLADGEIARPAAGEAALGRPTAGVGTPAQGRRGRDDAARHEAGDDPSDRRVADQARKSGPSLARPHIGKSWRRRWTACRSSGVQVFGRTRRGRRLFGLAPFSQR